MANVFPRWTNFVPVKIAICIATLAVGAISFFIYYASPDAQRVGYQPTQPIPFSHVIHAGQLGMDCRYCHSFVEESGHANVPSANTCWNCHQHVKTDSPKLEPLRQAIDKNYENYTGNPVEWVKIHASPEYVKFNHSAHVNRGVSCVSCHGRVDEMEVVYQAESHTMGWCLDCHRAPEEHIRPIEQITNMAYNAEEYLESEEGKQLKEHAEKCGYDAPITNQTELGTFLRSQWTIGPKESCFTCHR